MNSEHVFTCTGRPQLKVDVRSGYLFIRGWDGAEVRISADEKTHIRQRGDKIIVDGGVPCTLKVYLPRASDVYVDGTDLDIDMGGLNGEGIIDVTGGKIMVEDWQGELEIDTSTCSIQCFQCQGDVNVDTSRGDVAFTSCQGNLWADTSSGSVKAENCTGSLEADTSGGDVILHQFRGPVHIDTGSGNVQLKGVSGRNVYVDCGVGSIEAGLPSVNPGRWRLSTGAGNISLAVPENISASFEIKGPHLDLSQLALIQSAQDRGQVMGMLNSGQGQVTVTSSRGRIFARQVPTAILFNAEVEEENAIDEESLKILTMLEKGAITTAEAERLLDALRGEEDEDVG